MRPRLRRSMQLLFDRVDGVHREALTIRTGDPLAERFAHFGERSCIEHPRTAIVNPGGVTIGDDVYIRAHVCIEALAAPSTTIIEIGSRIHIGNGVRFVAVNGIVLEDDTAVGHGSTLADTIHAYKEIDEAGVHWQAPLKLGRPLRVCQGAWIGNNCVVTGGIIIGEGAITSANTVINRDVPPDTVIGGNPARVLRHKRDGRWKWLVDPNELDLETQLAVEERQA